MPGCLSRRQTAPALLGAWLLLALPAPPAAAQSDPPDAISLASDATPAEGGAAVTITATLNNPVPAGNPETVQLSGAGSAEGGGVDYTLSSATLRFAAGDTEAAVTLRITDDNIVEGPETITLAVASTSRFSLTASPLSLILADNDDPGVAFDPSPETSSLILTEGGSGAYTIVLTAQPTASVTITPTIAPTSTRIGAAELSGPLTFTTGNWNSAQTVTVNALEDADEKSEFILISHPVTTTAAGYDSFIVPLFALAINDDDGPAFSLSGPSAPVPEGSNATLTISLNRDAPAGGLPFTVTTNFSGAAGTADTGALPTAARVMEGARTGTLTIPIARDREVDDGEKFTVSIAASVVGWIPASAGADTVELTIADTTNILRFTRLVYEIAEGELAVLGVERTGPASNAVQFTVFTINGTATAQGGDFAGGVYSGRLAAGASFTTVNIPTVDDSIDEGESETFSAAFGTGGDPDYIAGGLAAVRLLDDDTANVEINPELALLIEGGSNSYTVLLGSQPIADVTVTPASNNAAVTVRTARTDNTLLFTAGNWNIPQTVTLAAEQDADTNDESGISISNTAASRDPDYHEFPSSPVQVRVNDDDKPGVSFSVDRVVTVAEGASASYTLVLNTEPNAGVTITPSSDSSAVRVSGALIFTTENWNTAQTVTVAAEQDPDGNDELNIFISHTAASSDDNYNDIGLQQVAITVDDDEVIGAAVSPTALIMAEGDTARYTVALSSQPTAGVTITPSSDSSAVRVSGALVFTTENWSSAQTVTVTAEQDPDAEDAATVIRHIAGSTDRSYGSLRIVSVAVTVDDDEGVMIPVTEPLAVQEESAPITYTVTLGGNSPPANSVQLHLASSNRNVVTISPRTLTFTPDNWNIPQTVTITITGPGEAAITHTTGSSDRHYDSLAVEPVVVAVQPSGLTEDAVSRALLPELSQVLADAAVGAVARRIQQLVEGKASGSAPSAALGGQSTLGGLLQAHAPTLSEGQLDPETLLGASAFVLPLHGAAGDGAGDGAQGRAALTLWGASSYRKLSGGGKNDRPLDWDGEAFSAQLGLDARVHRDWLLGVAGAWGRGSTDYQDRTASDAERRKYRLTLSSIHPYVAWAPETFGERELVLWLAGGYGWGEFDMAHRNGPVTSDVRTRLAAGGGSIRLWERAGAILRLKVEGQQARTRVEDNPGRDLARHSLTTGLIRALLEAEQTMTLANGASLSRALALGMRHDGGDGRRGAGVHLAGSLRYRMAQGWQAEGGAQAFIGRHGYREWGLWGLARWAQRADGPGWSFSLRPRYGKEASTASVGARLWERTGGVLPGATGPGAGAASPVGRLDLRLSYGAPGAGAHPGQGRLVPWSELQLGAETRRYRLGLQWLLDRQWNVDLAAERDERRGRRNHSILLEGGKRY